MVTRKTLSLLLALLFSSTAMIASNSAIDAEPLSIMAQTIGGSNSRSDIPISATIDGHSLTIYISEDVGIANILVTNANGIYIDRDNLLQTPDMATLLIEDEGVYRVTITLSNGEVYYGDFQVTD